MNTYLFDYGGTLDTAATHWFYVFQAAYQSEGYSVSENQLREAYVMGERALAKEKIILPDDTFLSLLRKKIKVQVQYLENALHVLCFTTHEQRSELINNLALYCDKFARQHVQESSLVLKQIKQRHKMIMVSNFYGNLHSVLQEYGILDYFDAIIESSVVGVRKPDPAIWQLGVEASGNFADKCIVVGDSFSKDIIPASTIGCQTVWFKGREWENKNYNETIPTRIITSLSQLLINEL